MVEVVSYKEDPIHIEAELLMNNTRAHIEAVENVVKQFLIANNVDPVTAEDRLKKLWHYDELSRATLRIVHDEEPLWIAGGSRVRWLLDSILELCQPHSYVMCTSVQQPHRIRCWERHPDQLTFAVWEE